MIAGGDPGIGLFDAIVLGLVEGLTEFLPVSSTGHLILVQRWLALPANEVNNTFAIGIQMGAITAILMLYWRRLWAALRSAFSGRREGPNLLAQIAIAAAPAVALGLLADDWIDAHLFSVWVVVATMVGGGVLLLALDRWLRTRAAGGELAQMGYGTAFWIGVCQCLSLVPGTSRSAATIAGALLLGLSRPAAAEFSFLVGLPILYGASIYRLGKHASALTGEMVVPLVVATAVAFASALVVVGPFVRFLRAHSFAPFAWYRIVVGILLAVAVAAGWFG